MYTITENLISGSVTGRTFVRIKIPTFKDVRLLLTGEDGLNTAKNSFVQNCIDLDVDTLLAGDRDYLFLLLTSLARTDEAEKYIECSGCGKRITFSANPASFEIKSLGDLPSVPMFKLPVSGETVSYQHLSVSLEREMLSEEEHPLREIAVRLDREGMSYRDKIEWLSELTVADLQLFNKFNSMFYCGVLEERTITCECGKRYMVKVELDSSLLGYDANSMLMRYYNLSKGLS